MNETRRPDSEKLLESYRGIGFIPDDPDKAFLSRVRTGVTQRKRRRVITSSALSSIAAIVMLLVVLQGGVSLTTINWSGELAMSETQLAVFDLENTSQLALTEQMNMFDENTSGADSMSIVISRKLESLFEESSINDPVEELAAYDDDVQDEFMNRLRNMDIFADQATSGETRRTQG